MTLTDGQVELYRKHRAHGVNPYYAYHWAQAATEPLKYSFLDVPYVSAGSTYRGSVDGFDVEVRFDYDPEARLGDDDVTGWFTDSYDPECIKNTRRDWSTDYRWYHPANCRLNGDGTFNPEGMPSASRGMSKSVLADFYREVIESDMSDDANRVFYMLNVTVSHDGIELGSSTLGWIDAGPDTGTEDHYLLDLAVEHVDEALDEARDNLPKTVTALREHADVLVALAD